LFRVVEPFYLPTGAYEGSIAPEELKKIDAEHEKQAADYLQDVAGRAGLSGVTVKTEVARGKAAEKIAEYATQNAVDLVAIASHGRSGISRWVWGSVADRILRSACIPVLIVRAPGCSPSF
ncbi:MAG: universal stress protein, partial [Chloroflexota bacterium]